MDILEGLPILQLPAQMQAPKWRNDDSATITLVTTREVNDDEFLHLSNYKRVNGWLLFKSNEFETDEIPAENAPTKNGRSKSQQLRLALLRFHLENGGTKDNFEPFYERQMDRLIGQTIQSMEG